ncbi:hypothetical protein [Streptomyces sp. ERV7]|uniref:hypothetical protein n=1 Tax=Streptomyces sp. ERV7 TaxID=1322334 RepID=UPI000ACD3B32|nr:hypothetical protein [Streptomyces sp. ERV7]
MTYILARDVPASHRPSRQAFSPVRRRARPAEEDLGEGGPAAAAHQPTPMPGR